MKNTINIKNREQGPETTVSSIRRIEDIKAITKMIQDSPRDLLLFTMGINNGLRTGDLLKLHVQQVRDMKAGDTLTIREGKTGKNNILVVNKAVYKTLQNYLDKTKPHDDDYLFLSRKGLNRPLTVDAVRKLIKKWTSAINLNKENYGAHTLRKTWGYHQRLTYGVGFELIAKRYNHSSPAYTMRYLGITDKEIKDVLMNEIG